MYPILTQKKARRRTRLEKAMATELVQIAVINRSLRFLKLFKQTLDKFYDGNNWAVRTIHAKSCPTWYDEGASCDCTSLDEYTWLGTNPCDLVSEVFAKWEERNGPIQAVEFGNKTESNIKET